MGNYRIDNKSALCNVLVQIASDPKVKHKDKLEAIRLYVLLRGTFLGRKRVKAIDAEDVDPNVTLAELIGKIRLTEPK